MIFLKVEDALRLVIDIRSNVSKCVAFELNDLWETLHEENISTQFLVCFSLKADPYVVLQDLFIYYIFYSCIVIVLLCFLSFFEQVLFYYHWHTIITVFVDILNQILFFRFSGFNFNFCSCFSIFFKMSIHISFLVLVYLICVIMNFNLK